MGPPEHISRVRGREDEAGGPPTKRFKSEGLPVGADAENIRTPLAIMRQRLSSLPDISAHAASSSTAVAGASATHPIEVDSPDTTPPKPVFPLPAPVDPPPPASDEPSQAPQEASGTTKLEEHGEPSGSISAIQPEDQRSLPKKEEPASPRDIKPKLAEDVKFEADSELAEFDEGRDDLRPLEECIEASFFPLEDPTFVACLLCW